MIRTNDASAYRTLQYNLSKTSSTLNQLYIKTSTNKEVEKASDAPSSVRTIIESRSAMAIGNRYVENCKHVQDNLSTAESSIDSVIDLIDRANEIAIAAANASLSESDFATYANEVAQLQEHLLDLANTKVDGKYIFAGYNDQTIPFSGSPVVYSGTDDHQMIETSSGISVAKNITGLELFMDPVDIFAALDYLATALQGMDTSVISNQLTSLEDVAEQVRTQQSSLGNTSARMDDIITVHQSAELLLEAKLSRAEDADLTEVLSEVSKMELSLEATMQVTSRISSLNLFDYL
jgi:flagellar hook-associated protein 3 FlgL